MNQYYDTNQSESDDTGKNCPLCDQSGLKKEDMEPNLSVARLVNKLRVKCLLTHQSTDSLIQCEWKGILGELEDHQNNDCQLFDDKCPHCNVSMKRYKLEEHEEHCSEKEIKCKLCS